MITRTTISAIESAAVRAVPAANLILGTLLLLRRP